MRNSKDRVKELVHVGLEDTLEEEAGGEEKRLGTTVEPS